MYIFLNMYTRHTYSFFSFRRPRVHWYCKLCEESRFFIGYSNYPFKKRFTGVTLVDEWWWEAFPIRIDLAMNGSRSWKTFKLESWNLDIVTLCAKSLLPKKKVATCWVCEDGGEEVMRNPVTFAIKTDISSPWSVFFFPKEFQWIGNWEVPHFEQSFSDVIPRARRAQLPWMGCCSLHFRWHFDFECFFCSTYSKDETFFWQSVWSTWQVFRDATSNTACFCFCPALLLGQDMYLLGGQQHRRWRWKIWKRIGSYDIYGNIHDIVLVRDSICIYIYI